MRTDGVPFWKRLRPEQMLFLGFLALSLVLVVADFFRTPTQGFAGYRWMMLGLGGLLVVLLGWTLLGGLKGPALIFLGVVFAAFTYVALQWNGVHSVTVTMYVLLILIAVPLTGWAIALATTLLSLVALWYLALIPTPIPLALPPPPIQARNLSLVFAGVFLLVWWYHRRWKSVADGLRDSNAVLEQRVQERTNQVVISEKLATVGRLSAGLAHELNTPLAAVVSAQASAQRSLQQTLPLFLEEWAVADAARQALLSNLLVRNLAAPSPSLRPPAARERRRELSGWCLDAELAPEVCGSLVESLVDLPDLRQDEFVALGAHQRWREGANLLEAFHNLVRSLAVVDLGAEKMSHVVRSIGWLGRPDSLSEPSAVDPRDEIAAALVLLQSRFAGVEVQRRFEPGVVLHCRRDRLGQVLVNLITNALHAMAGKGTLGLEIRREGPFGLVEVSDTGHGVPEHLREKIFEPFFTTKRLEEGNGLGLDLSRRICVEEGGSLTLVDGPGTRFVIALPLDVGGGPQGKE